MSGHQPGGLQARAAIRHMREVETEFLVQLIAEEMRWRAGLVGGIAELAAVLFCPSQELREIFRGNAGMCDEHQRRLDATNERGEIVDRPALIGESARI